MLEVALAAELARPGFGLVDGFAGHDHLHLCHSVP
jgi:hypothetical protein